MNTNEDYCLSLLKEAKETGDFSKCENFIAKDAEYFLPRKSKKPLLSRRDAYIALTKKVREEERDKGNVSYNYLGRIEAYHGTDADLAKLAGKRAILMASGLPGNFRELTCIELNAENKISKIIDIVVYDYSISVDEDTHYVPNEYVYLNLLKEAVDTLDCSRIAGYVAYNVRYENCVSKSEGNLWYDALRFLDLPIRAAREENMELKTYLFRVLEGPYKGKIGIGTDPAVVLYFIEIKGGAKISSIKIVPYTYIGGSRFERFSPLTEICEYHYENNPASLNKGIYRYPTDGAEEYETEDGNYYEEEAPEEYEEESEEEAPAEEEEEKEEDEPDEEEEEEDEPDEEEEEEDDDSDSGSFALGSLRGLKEMLHEGVITREEFKAIKEKLFG